MPEVRVLVVADADSYVKYGAALADRLPASWRCRLVVAAGDASPSDRQYDDAVAGTRFAGTEPVRVDLPRLREELAYWLPDVVIAAARGHTVRATVAQIENVPSRPVVVSGIAGVMVPVLPHGLLLRRAVDVFVVHSRREWEDARSVAAGLGVDLRFELGTLPFLAPASSARDRHRIVFAGQALVPASRRQRVWLVERLADTARAHPDLEVVVKVRAVGHEAQTHAELVGFEDVVAAMGKRRPANLLVEAGPMREHLRHARGLVTVSSTALLEAVAAGVPVLALTDFGVGASQINLVLAGSGVLGSTDDLVAGRFRDPEAPWLERNYFHDPSDDTWLAAVEELLAIRRTHGLPARAARPAGWRNRLRAAIDAELAFRAGSSGLLARMEATLVRMLLGANRLRWRLLAARIPDEGERVGNLDR